MGIEGIENLQEEGAVQEVQTPGTEVVEDPCPPAPTTSPDVVIINDPGPAPEGDSPPDDGSLSVSVQVNDPPSDDAAVDVTADDADA